MSDEGIGSAFAEDDFEEPLGRSGIHVGRITLLCAAMAFGMSACTSEDIATEPSGSPSLGRADVATYSASDLGTLGGERSEAIAINPAGQVVGSSSKTPGGPNRAFLWENGIMTDLGTLGGESSEASDINPAGQVVGKSDPAGALGAGHAFLWENGVMTDLGTLGGCCSAAFAISPAGQVVGEASTAAGEVHPFIWEKGVMTDLGTLGGSGSNIRSRATGINPAGQVVGESQTASGETHAFLWVKGVMTRSGHVGWEKFQHGARH